MSVRFPFAAPEVVLDKRDSLASSKWRWLVVMPSMQDQVFAYCDTEDEATTVAGNLAALVSYWDEKCRWRTK